MFYREEQNKTHVDRCSLDLALDLVQRQFRLAFRYLFPMEAMRITSSIRTIGLRNRNKFSQKQKHSKILNSVVNAEKSFTSETAKKFNMDLDRRNCSPMPYQMLTGHDTLPGSSIPRPEKPKPQYVDSGLGKGIPFLRTMCLCLFTSIFAMVLIQVTPNYAWWSLALPGVLGSYWGLDYFRQAKYKVNGKFF